MAESQKYIQICRFAKFISPFPFLFWAMHMAERQEITELQDTTFPISTPAARFFSGWNLWNLLFICNPGLVLNYFLCATVL